MKTGLILHTGAQRHYYYFLDKIIDHIQQQPDSFIYLLPVNRAVRHLKKKLVRQAPNQVLIEPAIFTFNSLIQHGYPFLPSSRKVIPRAMRMILIDQILKEQGPELGYFRDPLPANTGFINRIDQMLDEFCEFGYQPKDFTQPPSTCEEKYKDFGRILAILHHKYGDQLLDEGGLISEVIQGLDEPVFRQIFPGVQNIYISGYGIYTPPMLEFIRKSHGWCRVEIKLEYDPKNFDLFAHVQPAYDALKKMAASEVQVEAEQDFLYHHFFNTNYTGKPAVCGDRFVITGLKNKEQEVAFMASSIRKLHLENRIPLYQFGISFPDLEKYAPLIRNVFRDYDLPYNLSTGFSLAQSPLIQAYLQVLKVVVQDFPGEDIYALLLSPFLKQGMHKHAAAWRQMTTQLRMRYLSRDWEQRARLFINFKKSQYDQDEENRDMNFIADLESMMVHLSPIMKSLQALPAEASVSEFKAAYRNILNELGMLEWVEQSQDFLDRPEQERIYRALNRFIKLLDQLTWILTFLWKEQPVSLADYYRYLLLMIQQATYNLREWSEFGVQIMPRLEIQALECNYLFIGGLLEGDFPRHFRRDIFFNDQERQQMGLTASEDILAQDRFIFYQLLSSGVDKIYLCFPKFDQDVELLPSTFLSNLKEVGTVVTGNAPIPDEFLLNRNTMAEYLSINLKSGLNEQQITWFNDWASQVDRTVTGNWLEGIEISYKRLARSTVNRFEGNLHDIPGVVEQLENKLGNKPFSITALETYAFCPMQYFLNRILKLAEEPEMEEIITPLEKGSLVHRILFRFYSLLKKSDTASEPAAHSDLLIKTALEEFDKLPYSGLPWTLEKEIYFGRPDLPGLWEKFLEVEKEEIAGTGFHPRYFEVAFGRIGSSRFQDPVSTRQPLVIKRKGKEVKLIGKIDRVDINRDNHFLVLDYKISRTVHAVKVEDLYHGRSLQLPVYLYAVSNRIDQILPVAAGYFQVRDAEHCERRLVFADVTREPDLMNKIKPKSMLPAKIAAEEVTLRQLVERSLDFVVAYTDDIRSGKFYHTTQPEDARCQSYCPYNKICRKDVMKLKFLSAQRENIN